MYQFLSEFLRHEPRNTKSSPPIFHHSLGNHNLYCRNNIIHKTFISSRNVLPLINQTVQKHTLFPLFNMVFFLKLQRKQEE